MMLQRNRSPISINRMAMKYVRLLLLDPEAFGVAIHTLANGTTVLDMGQEVPGGWEAARYYALITLGGLGQVSYGTFPQPIAGNTLPSVNVHIDDPLLACVASQIAGWKLRAGDSAPILAGPARALNRQPDAHIASINYRDRWHEAVIAIQTTQSVPMIWAESIAQSCGIDPCHLYILVAPSRSLVGAVQVAARSVEQTIHRLEEVGLPLNYLCYASGHCVLPPLTDHEHVAMGRINDALIYGSESTIYLRTEREDDLSDLAAQVVTRDSGAEGRLFQDIYEEAGRDFYQIPIEWHTPAVVHLNNLNTGRTFSAGHIDLVALTQSFFE